MYTVYIFIYIEKKNITFCVLLQKNETFSRSFTFFAKERCILCILLHSLKRMLRLCVLFRLKKKNGKEHIVLLGFISRQKLKKRMEKNVVLFKRTEKNRTFRAKKNAVPNPVSLAQSLEKSKPCYGYLKPLYKLLINLWSAGQKIHHFDYIKCTNLIILYS